MKQISLLIIVALLSTSLFGQDKHGYYAFSRLDYYTDEPAGEIAVFVPVDKTGKKIYFDLVYAQEIILRMYPGVPGRTTTIPFSLEKLKIGDNEITVSFYEDDQWMDSRKVNVILREKRIGEVKTDRLTGALVARRMPFFPLVKTVNDYDGSPDLSGALKQGFNTVKVRPGRKELSRKRFIRFLDDCALLGLKVVVDISDVVTPGDRVKISSEDFPGKLDGLVNHPALLSYLYYNSEKKSGFTAKELQQKYELLKAWDPYHPVSAFFSESEYEKGYAGLADLIILTSAGSYSGMKHAGAGQTELEQQPFWISTGKAGKIAGDEQDSMNEIVSGLQQGATGILLEKDLPGDLAGHMNWSINEILPQLLAGNPVRVSAMDPSILATGWSGRGGMVILASNFTDKGSEISLRAEGLEGDVPARVLYDDRVIEVRSGVLSDTLPPGSHRFYRIIRKEDVHFRDPSRKKNMIVNKGFELITGPGIVPGCESESAFIAPETRLTKEGARALNVQTGRSKNTAVFFEIKEWADQGPVILSVWARTKPSTVNHQLRKGFFKKRQWKESMPGSRVFAIGLSKQYEALFDISPEWKKYEITVGSPGDLPDGSRPYIILPSNSSLLFDDMMLVPVPN